MSTLLTHEAVRLIYATVSSMHSIASTLTGEAKSELSTLHELLEHTDELPRDDAAALAEGVLQVRDHLTMGPTDDPVGDGNKLWDVFLAAWALRAPVAADPPTGKQQVLERLGYVIECIAQACHGDAKDELFSICEKMTNNPSYRFPGSDKVLAELESAYSNYLVIERRREALQTVCRTNRQLWKSM